MTVVCYLFFSQNMCVLEIFSFIPVLVVFVIHHILGSYSFSKVKFNHFGLISEILLKPIQMSMLVLEEQAFFYTSPYWKTFFL